MEIRPAAALSSVDFMGKEYGGDGVRTKRGGQACNPSIWESAAEDHKPEIYGKAQDIGET